MSWLNSLVAGVQALFARRRVEQELDEELDLFQEQAAEHNERLGMTLEEARRAARVAVGSRNSVKQKVWASRWESVVENLWKDARLGTRSLLRTPGFTAIATISLALGIGANTAIFTLLNAVMLRSLPVEEPRQLVLFGDGSWVGSMDGMPNRSWRLFSYPFYRAFAARTNSFSGVTAVSSIQMRPHLAASSGVPEEVHIDLVSGNYFSVLGVLPALGRTINKEDDRTVGAGAVAVASYAWFQRHFGGNPAALGTAVSILGHDYTIIGVAQPGFVGLAPSVAADMWIPLSMEKEISPGWNGLGDKNFQSLYLIGRLKPGLTTKQATASSNLLFRQIIRDEYLGDHPSEHDLAELQKANIELTSASGGLPGLRLKLSTPLTILMGIVVLVLLIACVNIANMLLARGVGRSRELAVRQALGATRARIVAQLTTESTLLALGGAALGVLVAWSSGRLLTVYLSHGVDARIPEYLAPDVRVLLFTLAVTGFTALLFGMLPAVRAARLELTPVLKEGRGGSQANARGALSRGLIVGQIAISVLLLVAAGLFLRSLVNLNHVDLGFEPKHAMVFELDEQAANIPVDSRLTQVHQQIEQNVRALPGVEAASFSMFAFNQGEWSDSLTMEGVPRTEQNGADVLYNVVGTNYLKAFGKPLVAGRNFNNQDTEKSPHIALVNETLARTFFPDSSAIGHHFSTYNPEAANGKVGPFDIEIVGVVRDARYEGIGERQHMAAYFPYTQRVQYFWNFTVRTNESPASLLPAVRRTIAQVNPQIIVSSVLPLTDMVEDSIKTQRLIGLLSAFFAALAVFLVAIGIYGLISYSVARRTSEIGIRVALGARASAIVWLVVRESLALLVAGLAVGLPIALLTARSLSQFLKAMLFQVTTVDPVAYALAVAVACIMTLCAAYMPARRAAAVNPVDALRCE
ncbi:MAG: ABC transporter permease [Terracidiphilus sp.]